MYPIIKKAKLINGANIILRNASVDDAQFLFSLRLDPLKNKYLSETSSKIDDQIKWLNAYESQSNQFYFIVCDKNMNKLGCARIYDPVDFSYSWGSWLIVSGLSPLISIESALLVYAYGRYLGFKEAKIQVRKSNNHVWNFHEKFFSAERVGESNIDYFYIIRKNVIDEKIIKYSKLITHPLDVKH